jgi:hypothetical protein
MSDAGGGYYTDHHVVIPLRESAASMVVYRDGSVDIGEWGSAGEDDAGRPCPCARTSTSSSSTATRCPD